MKLKVQMIVMLFSLIASGQSIYDATPRKWYSCKEDSDCEIVNTGCLNNVVNKRYLEEYRNWAKKEERAISCEVLDGTKQKKIKHWCKIGKCAFRNSDEKSIH